MGIEYAKFVFLKENPDFNSSYLDDDVYIIHVWLTLRRLFGVNHWGVAFELSNDKYGIVQFEKRGVGLSTGYKTLEDACLATWGKSKLVRTSNYGTCYIKYNCFVDYFYRQRMEDQTKYQYFLGFNDCQNFAREIVYELTQKRVGTFPIEDGPEFGGKNEMSIKNIHNKAGPVVATLCIINPGYWIGRGVYNLFN